MPAELARRQEVALNLPINFEPTEEGARAKFVSRGAGYALALGPGEAALRLRCSHGAAAACRESDAATGSKHACGTEAVVRLRFVGADSGAVIEGVDRRRGLSHYYRGSDPSKWRAAVPHFGKARYRDIYPGIDLVFYGQGRQLEYDLVVAPGADPSQIRIDVEGAEKSDLDAAGNLVLQTAAGALRMRKPIVYQELHGQRHEVEGRYIVAEATDRDAHGSPLPAVSAGARANSVAFQLAKYDASRALVIDPLFDFSAGFGGTMRDEAFGVAAGPGGSIYVVGSTSSIDFPVTTYGAQKIAIGDTDAWVAYLNGDGTELISSTYFGGSEDDEALAVAVDRFGIAHVTGYTQSADFPVHGSLLSAYGGLGDAFMAAFSISGASLYALYFGGSGIDQGNGIAVDPNGGVYVSGWTRSTNLPVVNALQPANAGLVDAFVAKLNPTAASWDYATYLGGNNHEHPTGGFIQNSNRPSGGIAVDTAGNAYVTGTTLSAVFPTVNGYRTSGGGVFLSKLNPAGSALSYSSTFGGGSGFGLDTDDNGHVFLTGRTLSQTFPTRLAVQATYGGSGDAFLLEVDTTKSGDASLVSATYLGGDGDDAGYDVEYDEHVQFVDLSRIYISGKTDSTNMPFASQPSGGSILQSTDGGATWTKKNTGLASADLQFSAVQVNCIAADPLNPQIAYAGTENAGVFKTTNGGDLWVPSNTGLDGGITALAVQPGNSSTVYAGTFQNGIYVSTNAGFSWAEVNGGLQTNAPFVSFVFGGGAVYAASDFNGVFKTTNGGMTWLPMNTGLTDLRIQTLAIDPEDPNRLLAGTGGRSSPSGIYETLNGGANWALKNANLATVFGPSSAADLYISALLIFSENARILFALAQSDSQRVGGMAKSTDDGATWTAIARFGDPETDLTLFAGYQARSFVVDPSNPNNILVATTANSGRGIIRTSDGGQSWTATGPFGTDVNLLSFVNFPGPIYAATNGGNDGFVTSVPTNGSTPATQIVGGTGDDELRAMDAGEFVDALFSIGRSSADFVHSGLQPPPNSIPAGNVIEPAQPQNPIVVATPLATPRPMSADLSVTKEITLGSLNGIQGVRCRITVTNNGPDTARNVKLLDHGNSFKTTPPIVAGDYVDARKAPSEPNTIEFDLGDLPSNPEAAADITVFYPVYQGDGPDLGKRRHNTVQVYMDSSDVQDPVVSNDYASDDILVPQSPPGDVPSQTANQSTRVVAGTGDRAPNSGTIITAPQSQQRKTRASGHRAIVAEANGETKKVIFRAIGPSLQAGGAPLQGRLENPTLELYNGDGNLIGSNDNWRETQIGGVITTDQQAAIEASGIPPTHDLESAIIAEVPPGIYTTIIRGAGDTTGISLAEVYDLDTTGELRLANISTRGFVDTGDNVMIGGVILLGGDTQQIVFRAIGPSLSNAGVAGALADPVIEIYDASGNVVRTNDNWRSDQEAELIATTIPPSSDAEAAVLASLTPGAYTAVVRGANDTTGVALVEVYNLNR